MKKIFLLGFLLVSGTVIVWAQNEELIIKEAGKGKYVEHKVAPKENFYSIGRLFTIHPKHLAQYNALDMSKGLSLGQLIKIPLSDSNYNQKIKQGSPVYYLVGEKETLARVSQSNNNVLLKNLRDWNKLKSDEVSKGQKLIVGFINGNAGNTAMVTTMPAKEDAKMEVKEDTRIAEKTPEEHKPAVPEEKKKEPVKEKEAEKPIVSEEPKKNDVQVVVKNEEPKSEINNTGDVQGYFRSDYEHQVKQQPATKEQTVTSGIFKTTSGWSDAKYYLLMDNVEPGTIIKITNPGNNKIVYAKVLGEMSGIKQNQGLNIRMSNAAASALAIDDNEKFIVKVNY